MTTRTSARLCVACGKPGARRVVGRLVSLDVDALPLSKPTGVAGLEILACVECHPEAQ